MIDWQVVRSTTDISILLIIGDVFIWWALFCTVFKEYNDIALTSNVQTFCKYTYKKKKKKRCIWKLTKNVVVYWVILLICNNYLSGQLNSDDAIEELLALLGFFVVVFLLYANCWVLYCLHVCTGFAESSRGCRQGKETTTSVMCWMLLMFPEIKPKQTIQAPYAVSINKVSVLSILMLK